MTDDLWEVVRKSQQRGVWQKIYFISDKKKKQLRAATDRPGPLTAYSHVQKKMEKNAF